MLNVPPMYRDATLLIIGHGSTVNGDSGATVYQHAAELRRRGLFADVREAFFKIEPRIGAVLDAVRTPRAFVVPLFTAEGYFTRQAIPCELGLPAGTQDVMPCKVLLSGREVIYCDPVGTHPLMTEIILARADAALAPPFNPSTDRGCPQPQRSASHGVSECRERPREALSPPFNPSTPQPFNAHEPDRGCPQPQRSASHGISECRERPRAPLSPPFNPSTLQPFNAHASTALVVAGHGTDLNPDSRKSIERQVELIAARKLFAEVHPAFLEEEPRIADIPNFVRAPRIVVVPFFMSDGLHVCEDIPVLLGESAETVQTRLKAGEWPWRNPTERRGKTIFYTPGVGSEPGLADVILDRVRAAATP